jgi:hypothetical protein
MYGQSRAMSDQRKSDECGQKLTSELCHQTFLRAALSLANKISQSFHNLSYIFVNLI